MELVILSKETALRELPRFLKPGDACYYLSDDYISLTKIRKTIGDTVNIYLFEERFHEAVKTIQHDFLRFSHSINKSNDSDVFWGTHLASRNSASIPLLKYLAYFHCALQVLGEAKTRMLFICDSHALALLLKEAAEERYGLRCSVSLSRKERVISRLVYFRLFFRGVFFLLSRIAVLLHARRLENPRIRGDQKRKRYVLRSWFTAGCINKDGKYSDRNFGELAAYLEKQGIEVWNLPVFFNLNKNIFSQLKEMSHLPDKFIIQEQYLTVLDIVRTLIDGILAIHLKPGEMPFSGQDMRSLVREIHLSISVSPPLLERHAVKYLLKRLSKQGVEIDRFIYPLENNVTEKPFILALREHYPKAEIIGFQHTVWLKEQFAMTLIPEELEYHPLPDRIVCSGRRYMGVLQQTGFPPERLSLGPNLRYTMVNNQYGKIDRKGKGIGLEVLIILSGLEHDNYEILEKSGAAIRGMEDVNVYIKTHPLNPLNRLNEFLNGIQFPRYEFAQGSVQDWVIKADAVIMGSGSVSNLETMAMGVPLLRVSLGNNFDLDPLWDEYPFAPFIRTPDEMRGYLELARTLPPAQSENLVRFGAWLVENYFEPVAPEKMEVFVSTIPKE